MPGLKSALKRARSARKTSDHKHVSWHGALTRVKLFRQTDIVHAPDAAPKPAAVAGDTRPKRRTLRRSLRLKQRHR